MVRSFVDRSELRQIEAAARGDAAARQSLFERYREVAYRVALRITGRHEDALDAVQDGFIRAFDGLAEFQRESGFQTWLLRIVSNRALDLVRARRVRLAVPLNSDDEDCRAAVLADERSPRPGAALEQSELAERLRAAIEALPPDQRAVFALYATGELSYGQIAEALGIPIGTVMSRLFHARRRLYEKLPDLAAEWGVEARPPK